MNSSSNYDTTDTIKVINNVIFKIDGPRGGAFIGENENEISYRIFRIYSYNSFQT